MPHPNYRDRPRRCTAARRALRGAIDHPTSKPVKIRKRCALAWQSLIHPWCGPDEHRLACRVAQGRAHRGSRVGGALGRGAYNMCAQLVSRGSTGWRLPEEYSAMLHMPDTLVILSCAVLGVLFTALQRGTRSAQTRDSSPYNGAPEDRVWYSSSARCSWCLWG
ncbi:hypothetical protein PsYK624_128980 [Phanerochaete sordida]|uniref:Uncharacterized protein n=1 Tax=Phanerochaete sordida TaxID=48140 RepID=A0A9P3GNN2_9APHY|nr:hypothetical protein PsYK624_128980 [Phanerochaete sordida]